jgi:hypothetical protein
MIGLIKNEAAGNSHRTAVGTILALPEGTEKKHKNPQ